MKSRTRVTMVIHWLNHLILVQKTRIRFEAIDDTSHHLNHNLIVYNIFNEIIINS